MLSVNAGFLNGILSIELSPGLDPAIDSAALIIGPDDQSFLVDINGNGILDDPTELSGQVADLQRLVVDGQNGFGKFAWYGDFTNAAFQDTPLASINLRGLESVTIASEINTDGFLTIRNVSGTVQLGGGASYAGQDYQGQLEIGESLNVVSNSAIITGLNSRISVEGNARFESNGNVTLATGVGDELEIAGFTEIVSGPASGRLDVRVGAAETLDGTGPFIDLNRISATGRSVEIFESNDLVLDRVQAEQLTIGAGGDLQSHTVAGIEVTGLTQITADRIDMRTGRFVSESLQFNSPGDVFIQQDADIQLAGISTAGDLVLESTGSISDSLAVGIQVAGQATFDANEIDLTTSDFNAGELSFRSSGVVMIHQRSATALFGQSQAAALELTSDGSITDDNGTSLNVVGRSTFAAQSIEIENSQFRSAELQFTAPGRVAIDQQNAMTLVGVNEAGDLELTSSDLIEDAEGTEIFVTTDARLQAQTGITLTDFGADSFQVTGQASFETNGNILVGQQVGSRANFGRLALYGRDVQISEGSSSQLASADPLNSNSVVAENLFLQSIDSITQVDAVSVNRNASFSVSESGDVLLARSQADNELMDNRFEGDIRIDSTGGALGDVQLRDITTGDARTLGTMAGDLLLVDSIRSLEVLLPNRSLEIVGPQLTIDNDLQFVVGMDGDGDFAILSQEGQSIRDSNGSNLQVGGDLTLRSSGSMILADIGDERLQVDGTTMLVAGFDEAGRFAAAPIRIGASNGGEVTLSAVSLVGSDIQLFETSDILVNQVTADTLALNAAGAIHDVDGAEIRVSGDASFQSLGAITLADSQIESDVLQVIGTALFTALGGLDSEGRTLLEDVRVGRALNSDQIQSSVELGRVDVVGRGITLIESNDMRILRALAATAVDQRGQVAIAGGSLDLISGASIRNVDFLPNSIPGSVTATTANVDAATWLVLDAIEVQQLSFHVGENLLPVGSEDTFLRSLRNQEAVASSLDVFSDINQAFTRGNNPAAQALGPNDPATLQEIANRFNFEATHAGAYAAVVRNVGTLELGNVQAIGSNLNLYIETVAQDVTDAANLVLSNRVLFSDQRNSFGQQSEGGLVLIAGSELEFADQGEIVSAGYRIRDLELNASAFQGGEGIGANFSTARALPIEASQLDPLTQHYQQQIAAVFGSRNGGRFDEGFQHVVAYADGNYQTFDVVQSTTPGTADLLIRENAFDIDFLSSWGATQLPTSVVFRRAEGVFLYDNGGTDDLAATSFAATASSDFVNDVFVGTSDPPPPPIAQPAPPPELPLAAPFFALPDPPSIAIEISSIDDARPPSDNVVEIVIAAIPWEEHDNNPKNKRLDQGEFNHIEADVVKKGESAFLADLNLEIIPLPATKILVPNATDEQIDSLIDDIQTNAIDYVDEDGQPLFTKPVYGVIQQDQIRGKTLYRLFPLNPFDSDEPSGDPSDVVGSDGVESEKEDSEADISTSIEAVEGSVGLPVAVWITIDRLKVHFDRASRARRRRLATKAELASE